KSEKYGICARINFYREGGKYTNKSGDYILPGSEGYSVVTFQIPTGTYVSVTGGADRQNAGNDDRGNFQYRNLKLEKGNTATDWTPAPEDMATSKQVSSIEQKANSIQALVGTTKESVARAVMTSKLWETEVASEISGMSSTVSQLSDSWALKLKSGNDIKTQINASTDSIRLQSKFIHLNGSSLIDNATIKSAHIDTLN